MVRGERRKKERDRKERENKKGREKRRRRETELEREREIERERGDPLSPAYKKTQTHQKYQYQET